MIANSLDAVLAPRSPLTSAARTLGSFDLAPTRDCDSLIATFAMFVARLSRCTRFDLAFFEADTVAGGSTLQLQLDSSATVATTHAVVDAALARARAGHSTPPTPHLLPVGISLVSHLDDAAPTAPLLTLVLSRAGAARWRFDSDAFNRAAVHEMADRFTGLLSARATSRWIRAPFSGAPLRRLVKKSRLLEPAMALPERQVERV